MQATSQRNISNAMAEHFDEAKREIFTSLPGKIVSYDPKTQTCSAQPLIARNGEQYPVVYNVPVAFSSGGGAVLTFPVKAGDLCQLHYSMFPHDELVNGDGNAPVEENTFRSHDQSECTAYVGGFVTAKNNHQPDPDNVMLRHGKTVMTLDDSGTVRITGKLIVSDTITGTDFISSTTGVKFNDHVHHYFWTDPGGDADSEKPS